MSAIFSSLFTFLPTLTLTLDNLKTRCKLAIHQDSTAHRTPDDDVSLVSVFMFPLTLTQRPIVMDL